MDIWVHDTILNQNWIPTLENSLIYCFCFYCFYTCITSIYKYSTSINYFYSQKKLLFKKKRKVILNKHKEWRNALIPQGNKQLNPNVGHYVRKMSDIVALEIFRRTKVRGEPLEKLMKLTPNSVYDSFRSCFKKTIKVFFQTV